MTDPKPCLPGCRLSTLTGIWYHAPGCPNAPKSAPAPVEKAVGFECDTCGLKADDLAIVAALRAEVERLRGLIAAAADVDPKQASYDNTITSRTSAAMRACELVLAEGRAILAASQKEGNRD